MKETVKVFVYASADMFILIKSYFLSHTGIAIVGHASGGENINLSGKDTDIVLMVAEEKLYNECCQLASDLKAKGIAFIVASDDAPSGFDWLRRGALAIVTKGKGTSSEDTDMFLNRMYVKCINYRQSVSSGERVLKKDLHTPIEHIIVIGSSTGGTEVVLDILKKMPYNAPPILVVQHMPAVFTKLYSERMNIDCAMTIWEAKDGDKLRNGLALVAPGSFQMRVVKNGDEFQVKCSEGSPSEMFNPSADVLFESVARLTGVKTIGVILTGMGSDGAKGLLSMRRRGAFTIGQSEASCVVYGMPKEAYDIGAVEQQADFRDIASIIIERLKN